MYIRIDNKIFNFPELPTNEDIYTPQIIDGVPIWVIDENKVKENRKKEILEQLNQIDLKTIRPLREGEADRVEALKAQALVLRLELQSL